MKLLAYLRSIAGKFARRSQIADEMDEELRSHIALRADDLERSGMNRAEAERQARIEFGGQERFKEECHEALGGNSSRAGSTICATPCACCANLPDSRLPQS